MRTLSVRLKREIVSIAVVVALIAMYLPFEDEAWSIYAALCAAYSILVFGMLWSDGKWRKYVESHGRTMRDLAQGHAFFLLALILWIWICRFARPWLPGWMFDELYRNLNYYLIFSGIGIVAAWWIEQSWLAKSPPKTDERTGVLPQ